MKIGFDAKRAAQNATGLGNYSRYIIGLLAGHADDAELSLYVPNRHKTRLLDRLPSQERLKIVFPQGAWSAVPSLWRTWGITGRLQRDGIRLYHGLSNELPLNIRRARGLKSVVTIHDLLFLRYPEGYHAADRRLYNLKYRRSCLNADRIIAVSEFTKQDIVRYYGIRPERISVVCQGCDDVFRHPAGKDVQSEARAEYHLPEHYILSVGTVERRKNLMLLAKALRHLPEETQVVAVGRHTPYAREVQHFLQENGLGNRMHLIGNVAFRLLPAVYQMADVFVYPSRCEGFGIPLLEALCSGVPAIGCTGSCLEEAGGPDSAYVDPDDDKGLANALRDILNRPGRRERMIQAGHSWAGRFTDEEVLKQLLKVYEETLKQV